MQVSTCLVPGWCMSATHAQKCTLSRIVAIAVHHEQAHMPASGMFGSADNVVAHLGRFLPRLGPFASRAAPLLFWRQYVFCGANTPLWAFVAGPSPRAGSGTCAASNL